MSIGEKVEKARLVLTNQGDMVGGDLQKPVPCTLCGQPLHLQCTRGTPELPVPPGHALIQRVEPPLAARGRGVPGEMTFFCCLSDTSLASDANR